MCAEKGRAVGEPPLRPPRRRRSCCSSLLLQCPKSSQPNCFRGRRAATTILHPEASAQGSKRLPEVKAHPNRRLRTFGRNLKSQIPQPSLDKQSSIIAQKFLVRRDETLKLDNQVGKAGAHRAFTTGPGPAGLADRRSIHSAMLRDIGKKA